MVDHPTPGQTLATSAEVTLNGSLVMESFPNPLDSGLGIIVAVICSDTRLATSPLQLRIQNPHGFFPRLKY